MKAKTKPPIDKDGATDVEAQVLPAPEQDNTEGDVPMPTIENQPAYVFRPKSNIGTKDVMEIALMIAVSLLAPNAAVAKGALRNQLLPAERFESLSDEAQQHLQPAAPPKPQPEADVADAAN